MVCNSVFKTDLLFINSFQYWMKYFVKSTLFVLFHNHSLFISFFTEHATVHSGIAFFVNNASDAA